MASIRSSSRSLGRSAGYGPTVAGLFMPITLIRDTQIRPVDPTVVATAEKRFRLFFILAFLCLLVISFSMFIERFELFWRGNRLWSIGSLFVCISVLHSRFFDIKKYAAPHNQRLDPTSLSTLWSRVEKCCAHVWLVGFILLAVARWKPY